MSVSHMIRLYGKTKHEVVFDMTLNLSDFF